MRPGFTLVELLAVVAIMAIILVIAVPAFHLFGKKDLDTAAAELRTTLRLARQDAVTRRQEVFVVFPTADWPVQNEEDVDKLLRSYAVLAKTNNSPEQFEYVTEWHYLPQGIYFDDNPSLPGTPFKVLYPFPFPDAQGIARDMGAVKFTPKGWVYRYKSDGWGKLPESVSIYLTTAHRYRRKGKSLDDKADVPGVTNIVRVRGYTGQVEIRWDKEQY